MITIEKVTVPRVGYIVEFLCLHSIVLLRFFEALLLKDKSNQTILKVHEL